MCDSRKGEFCNDYKTMEIRVEEKLSWRISDATVKLSKKSAGQARMGGSVG